MKINYVKIIVCLMVACATAFNAFADTHYVDINNVSPVAPYTNWSMAANNIQDAVDAAVSNDTVLVTNGTYNHGVVITKDIEVKSVNGPSSTIIDGLGVVRCLDLEDSACIISGFTIQNGASFSGAGILCDDTTPVVTNCVLRLNIGYAGGGMHHGTANNCTIYDNAAYYGGGISYGIANNCNIYNNIATNTGGGLSNSSANNCIISGNSAINRGVLNGRGGGLYSSYATNCVISGNSAFQGGGMDVGTAVNCLIQGNTADNSGGGVAIGTIEGCTVVENNAVGGGGVASCNVYNSIIWYNTASGSGANVSGLTASKTRYNCSPDVTDGQYGNITSAPIFVDLPGGDYRLVHNSPCIDIGDNQYASRMGVDLDGNSRMQNGVVDMGSFEFVPVAVVYAPSLQTNYVNILNVSPAAPYASWATAANTIQEAVDEAQAGNTVLVDDGVYVLSSEIVVDKQVYLQSVNGSSSTIINGAGTVHCLNLGKSECIVSGLTLTNGNAYGSAQGSFGGIVYCKNWTPVVTNCVVTGSRHTSSGGGLYSGTVLDCIVDGNNAYHGGGLYGSYVAESTIDNNHAEYGGGIYDGVATNCLIIGHRTSYGGGMSDGIATSCIFSNNSAWYGGAIYEGTVELCTVVDNSADSWGGGMYEGIAKRSIFKGNTSYSQGGGLFRSDANGCLITGNRSSNGNGGGMYEGTAVNCTIVGNLSAYSGGGVSATRGFNSISWYNMAGSGSNDVSYGPYWKYGCSSDVQHGANGNITNAPVFESTLTGDYRLSFGSPCINAGSNSFNTDFYDLNGNDRIENMIIDMGAFEWFPPPVIAENLRLMQREGSKLVDVYYDISSNATVLVAISNGTTSVASANVSGNVGSGVLPGNNKHIVWDGGADWDGNHATLAFTLTTSEGASSKSASVDFRDYTLSVKSDHGTPVPSVGIQIYAWRSTVTGSIDAVVSDGGINYTLTGWHGTGSIPVLGGGTNTGPTVLTTVSSSIDWRWIADADSDRMPDDWELEFFGSTTAAIATEDGDGDGYLNWQEYILGSNPTNGGSSLLFQSSSSQPTDDFSVDFATVPGRLYTVECTDELGSGDWQVLTNFVGDGSSVQIIDSTDVPRCFYHVKIDWVE